MLNNISILAIDPATTSGWCIWTPKGYHSYGEKQVYDVADGGVINIVNSFTSLTKKEGLYGLVVAEKWTMHGLSYQAYSSLSATWGAWKVALAAAKVPNTKVIRVLPATWRSVVLGMGPNKREVLKNASIQAASRFVNEPVISDNVADAICICRWAQYARQVYIKLPQYAQRACG